jgi:hypothetical protein
MAGFGAGSPASRGLGINSGFVQSYGGGSPVAQGAQGASGAPAQQQIDPNVLKSLTGMLNQPQAQVPAINNTSNPNPTAVTAQNALMGRAQGDMGAADAMRLSTVGIRDAASGMMRELAGNRSRRGVSGTGVDSIQDAGVANNALRAISGKNSQIAFDSERAKDKQLFGVADLALNQDASQRADRALANDQYQTASNAAAQQQQLQFQKFRSVLDLLGPLTGGGGFF